LTLSKTISLFVSILAELAAQSILLFMSPGPVSLESVFLHGSFLRISLRE